MADRGNKPGSGDVSGWKTHKGDGHDQQPKASNVPECKAPDWHGSDVDSLAADSSTPPGAVVAHPDRPVVGSMAAQGFF